MDRTVTPETMRKVVIQEGWLVRQFAKYVFGIDDDNVGMLLCDLEIPTETSSVQRQPAHIHLRADFADALVRWDALVAQKNLQYEDAWQMDGPVTALADLKDKLYRLSSATRTGAAISWDPDKKRSTIFDVIVRAMMVLAWDDSNFKDDDDERPIA